MSSTTAQQHNASLDADGMATDEPPDHHHIHAKMADLALNPLRNISNGNSAVSSSYSTQEHFKTSPQIPLSPSFQESTNGSISDYEHEHEHEHELDSPSSLSSWNSWAGGRRGDLADVEDLELDGGVGCEPELETVSELDEESSSLYSGSDRPALDSDEEGRLTRSSHVDHSPRRKFLRDNFGLHGSHHTHTLHPHAVHHASHLHPHGTPSYPHFSPRAGGHGLSHASRYSLRAPPNVAARKKKGRLSELSDESVGDGISTTKMPVSTKLSTTGDHQSPDSTPSPTPSPLATSSLSQPADDAEASPSTPIASSNTWADFEVFGPPPLPVRSVSPSETVPVVPSPLCECLTAEEQAQQTAEGRDESKTDDESITIRVEDSSRDEQSLPASKALSVSSPPLSTTSGLSVETVPAGSTPPTSPPASPDLVRQSSRNRRASSPTRTKPKAPLRPCFKRRTSAQSSRAVSSRESSLERNNERGRTKVRFSPAPPTEVRTHSPVDYDRKACMISNRLSPEDLEELRNMNMEMGLLEAKCAALAACRSERHADHDTESESETEQAKARWSKPTPDRKRADSVSSSAPTQFCGNRFAQSSHTAPLPSDFLRAEREKERERACRIAGIGTGPGFRWSGNPSTRQMPHGRCEALGASIVNRFGMCKPPPLPGTGAPPSTPTSRTSQGPTSSVNNSTSPTPSWTSIAPTWTSPVPSYTTPIKSDSLRPSSAPPPSHAVQSKLHSSHLFDASSSQQDEHHRGRSLVKSAAERNGHNDSASTDATVTESTPHLTRTDPSPSSSPERPRSRSRSPMNFRSPKQLLEASYRTRPPWTCTEPHTTASPSLDSLPPAITCGYDSPASEFYESGSEYDLIG